jgi:putative acetyltransferase
MTGTGRVGTEPADPRHELVVRQTRPTDDSAVKDVIERAFLDEPEVAGLWKALDQRPGTTSYVVEIDGSVVGHVGLSWGWVDAPARLVDVLVLSPLSVAPTHQRRGIGRTLVEHTISVAGDLGAPVLFLEGDPGYYGRLGFVPAVLHGFTAPSARIPSRAFQCVLLPAYDASVLGALIYPDTFWAFDAVGLRGERLAEVRRALEADSTG